MIDPLDALISSADVVRDPERFNRLNRIRLFREEVARHPGASPWGAGRTGLQSSDAIGYSQLLNRQKQFLDDIGAERGEGPLAVVPGYGAGATAALEGLRQASGIASARRRR